MFYKSTKSIRRYKIDKIFKRSTNSSKNLVHPACACVLSIDTHVCCASFYRLVCITRTVFVCLFVCLFNFFLSFFLSVCLSFFLSFFAAVGWLVGWSVGWSGLVDLVWFGWLGMVGYVIVCGGLGWVGLGRVGLGRVGSGLVFKMTHCFLMTRVSRKKTCRSRCVTMPFSLIHSFFCAYDETWTIKIR